MLRRMDFRIDSSERRLRRLVTGCAAASGALFTLLFGLTVASGVSQQWFELARPPGEYAAALVAGAGWLRALVWIDDAFIACYVATTLLFAAWLAGGRGDPLCIAIAAGGVAGGVLDLAENHHLLALLALAEHGLEPAVAELVARMTHSSLKWMLAHVAFFLAGLALVPRDGIERLFRTALLAIQLPVGALVWTASDPALHRVAEWMRAGNLFAGFFFIAWCAARSLPAPRVRAAAATGAPA